MNLQSDSTGSTGLSASTSSSNKRLLLFSIVIILYWISLYTYVPVLSPFLEDQGYSFRTIGIILGSYGFMQVLIRLPLGIWSDRLGSRKPFIIGGLAATSLSCLLFLVPGHWGWPLAARAMAGVSASAWVGFTVMFAAYYLREEATRAMSIISFLTVAGQLIGMSLSGWLADDFGWNAVFIAGAAVGAAGLILAFSVYEPAPASHHKRTTMKVKDLSTVIRDPMLLKVSVLSILAHGILFITMFGFTPSIALELGAERSQLTTLSIFFMVPHAIAALVSGRILVPRFGAWNTTLAGFALSGICTFVIPSVTNFGMLSWTQAVNGFAQGLHLPLLLGLAIQQISPEKRATAMGFYQSVYALGMFSGPFAAGWLNDSYGLSSGFYLGGALGIAGVLLILFSNKLRL